LAKRQLSTAAGHSASPFFFALGQKIRLEFNFSSDGGQDIGPQAGWFIDDVAIIIK